MPLLEAPFKKNNLKYIVLFLEKIFSNIYVYIMTRFKKNNDIKEISNYLNTIVNKENEIDAGDLVEFINSSDVLNEKNNHILKLLKNQIDYYKNELDEEIKQRNKDHEIINSLKSENEILKSEMITEEENLNKQLYDIMKKNYILTDKNKDYYVKILTSETNNKQIKDNYERKIKLLSDELEKSQTENKKLNNELETLKTLTSAKTSSSEYIDVDNYISSVKEIIKKDDLILLNTENIGLFDNITNSKSKTQNKNIDYFQEEIKKYNDNIVCKDPQNKDVFIKNPISFSTDYLPELLKNTDKINNHQTTEKNNKCINDNEIKKFKKNQNLEIIDEDDENEENEGIKEKPKIENKQLLGGYIPNTKGYPKNHIYNKNGAKKMLRDDGVFTTLTDQGDYDTKKKHLAYTRKTRRNNKK